MFQQVTSLSTQLPCVCSQTTCQTSFIFLLLLNCCACFSMVLSLDMIWRSNELIRCLSLKDSVLSFLFLSCDHLLWLGWGLFVLTVADILSLHACMNYIQKLEELNYKILGEIESRSTCKLLTSRVFLSRTGNGSTESAHKSSWCSVSLFS